LPVPPQQWQDFVFIMRCDYKLCQLTVSTFQLQTPRLGTKRQGVWLIA
jgi:hypothetical protein